MGRKGRLESGQVMCVSDFPKITQSTCVGLGFGEDDTAVHARAVRRSMRYYILILLDGFRVFSRLYISHGFITSMASHRRRQNTMD